MKKLSVLLAGVLLAFAHVALAGEPTATIVGYSGVKKVQLKFKTTFTTTQACNAMAIEGEFRKVPVAADADEVSMLTEYVADFGVISTMMVCDPAPKKTITLESKPVYVKADKDGNVFIQVLVPENFELEVTPIYHNRKR